ncbi:MAG: tRNA lysidine(34) synthetase TilS, partial [Alphaproteobacteria bacterium]
MSAEHARPLGEAEFAGLMEACGPFEHSPLVAVATSGGADSLALALLAHDWAVRRGGRAIGLVVDHALRRESATEAAEVAAWLGAAGIEPVVLRWHGPKPCGGVQAAARGARYALLESWCRDAGVLHLLLGHQRDDQAETVLMRRRRRAGPGLAGMAPTVETRDVRVTRPLL